LTTWGKFSVTEVRRFGLHISCLPSLTAVATFLGAIMRGMTSSFSAYCPICKETVHNAVLGHGSTENLQNDKGDVELAHPTNDPRVGDHKWKLSDPEAKARLRKLIAKENWDKVPDLPPYGRGQRPR